MSTRLSITKRYEKATRRLGPIAQQQAKRALTKFIDNPATPSLNFEMLAGRDSFYSIRVNIKFRILLRKTTDEQGELYMAEDVGPHDSYRRW